MDRFQWNLTINIFFLFKICVDGFLRSTYDDNEPMTISETSSSGSEGSLQDMADNGMSSYIMVQSTSFIASSFEYNCTKKLFFSSTCTTALLSRLFWSLWNLIILSESFTCSRKIFSSERSRLAKIFCSLKNINFEIITSVIDKWGLSISTDEMKKLISNSLLCGHDHQN